MRMLMLGEAISPHLKRWADELEKLGWEVVIASADYKSDFVGQKLYPSSSGGPLRYLQLVEPIKQLVDEVQPQIVNAHFLPTYGLAAAMANLHPLILTLWGSDVLVSGKRGWIRKLRSRFVIERADLVVGDAEHLLREAEKLGMVKRQLMVPYGVAQVWVESGEVRRLEEKEHMNIVSCRQLEPLYDVATLIRAAARLGEAGVDFQLSVVGEGSQRAILEALAAKLALDDSVKFLGHLSQEKLFTAYRNSDIYVSTARSDSTSVSLLEAMSQKLYPIVTDLPANREWFESDRHFFAAGDAEALAARIAEAVSLEARENSWQGYWKRLVQKGVREDQMKIADLTFRKLVEEFAR